MPLNVIKSNVNNFEDISHERNVLAMKVKCWYDVSAKDLVRFNVGDKVRIQALRVMNGMR